MAARKHTLARTSAYASLFVATQPAGERRNKLQLPVESVCLSVWIVSAGEESTVTDDYCLCSKVRKATKKGFGDEEEDPGWCSVSCHQSEVMGPRWVHPPRPPPPPLRSDTSANTTLSDLHQSGATVVLSASCNRSAVPFASSCQHRFPACERLPIDHRIICAFYHLGGEWNKDFHYLSAFHGAHVPGA